MFWWSHQARISTHIHLLCWLPWKVSWTYRLYLSHWHIKPRILLASIWDKGICPCPWCLILKSSFHWLGFLTDLSARISSIRLPFIQKILNAQQAIYFLGKPLKSTLVERILKPLSLVPTVVSYFQSGSHATSNYYHYPKLCRMPSQSISHPMTSIYFARLWLIYSTSLS